MIALGLTLAGMCLIVGGLDKWCAPVRCVELMRFPGNDVARERYEHRLSAAGFGKVRNVREVSHV